MSKSEAYRHISKGFSILAEIENKKEAEKSELNDLSTEGVNAIPVEALINAKEAEVIEAMEKVHDRQSFIKDNFPGVEAAGYTLKDVQDACKVHAKARTPKVTYEILDKYGAKKVADLDQTVYMSVVVDLAWDSECNTQS